MRFFTPLLSLAAAFGAVAAQEAARFGSVTVSPSSVKFDQGCILLSTRLVAVLNAPLQAITVSYNSSTAVSKPVAVDFYLSGTLGNGFVLPDYPLASIADMQNVSYVTFQRLVRL